jgi:hypothetical protein
VGLAQQVDDKLKMDRSGLKIMLPAWAGVVTSPTLPPPRPANASRLPGREMRQLSTSGSSGDSGSVRSLMDDEEECLGDGEGVMTPRMEGKGEVKVVSEDGKEEGEVEAWGWL